MKPSFHSPALQNGVRLGTALLLVAGLFLLGILLAPPAVPVQALNAPAPAAAPSSSAVNGTLASFTGLIPQLSMIHLPVVVK